LAAQMLVTRPNGALDGLDHVATITAALAVLLPLIMLAVEKRVRNKEQRVLVPASIPPV